MKDNLRNKIIEYLGIWPEYVDDDVNREAISEAEKVEEKYKEALKSGNLAYSFHGDVSRFYDKEKEIVRVVETMKHITVFEVIDKSKTVESMSDASVSFNKEDNFTWEDMCEKYPESRDEMSLEREREFIKDCFELHEREGFSDKFWSPFDDHKDRFGASFEVVGRCTEKDCQIDALPMWNIKFEDGTVIGAYPEEIIPSEMKENGCPYFESLEDKLNSAVSKSREVETGREAEFEFDRV